MPNNQVIGTSNLPQNPAVRDAITGAAATIPTQLVLFLFTQKKKKVSSQKSHCFIPKKTKTPKFQRICVRFSKKHDRPVFFIRDFSANLSENRSKLQCFSCFLSAMFLYFKKRFKPYRIGSMYMVCLPIHLP